MKTKSKIMMMLTKMQREKLMMRKMGGCAQGCMQRAGMKKK